jgi:hypothetical protein
VPYDKKADPAPDRKEGLLCAQGHDMPPFKYIASQYTQGSAIRQQVNALQ